MINIAIMQRSYDRHLPQEPEVSDIAIAARAAQLMLPAAEFDPCDPANIAEAISESLCGVKPDLADAISKLMATGNDSGIGLSVRCIVTDYWHKKAVDAAEEQLLEEMRNR